MGREGNKCSLFSFTVTIKWVKDVVADLYNSSNVTSLINSLNQTTHTQKKQPFRQVYIHSAYGIPYMLNYDQVIPLNSEMLR